MWPLSALLVAVIGLAQKATFNGKLLWFWTPQFFASNGFGPFVNRNHFAGWMLLALTLSVGLLFGHLSRSGRGPWLRLATSGAVATGPAPLRRCCCPPPPRSSWPVRWCGPCRDRASSPLVRPSRCCWPQSRRSKGSTQAMGPRRLPSLTVTGVVAWRGADTLFDWYGNTGTLQWRIQLWKDTCPRSSSSG